tara:strand:+ start:4159 stop:4695 length:537 start_codon:yes stop_codon:yes gene_type:complete
MSTKTYTKKCKECKEVFTPYKTTQKYCTKTKCLSVFIQETKDKAWKKKKAKMKEDIKTLQDYVKTAQMVFNKYIRERDKGNNCISCGKAPKKINAGHFYNANNHWSVRFDERNVHLQCEHCNTYLSGNLINYQRNLIDKIGVKEYNDLSSKANETRNFTKEELKEIIKYYKKILAESK